MKNRLTLFFMIFALTSSAQVGGIAVNASGASPDPDAYLDVSGTSGGILIPRMTQTQRNAIPTPALSLMIYQTDNTPGFYYYDGSAWTGIGGADNDWTINGNDVIHGNGASAGSVIVDGNVIAPAFGGGDTSLWVYSNSQYNLSIFEDNYDCGLCMSNQATAIVAKSLKGHAFKATAGTFGDAIQAEGRVFVDSGDVVINTGRLVLNTNTDAGSDGVIRWNGTDFEGYLAGSWESLTAPGSSDWTNSGSDIYRTTGVVGIGIVPPVFSTYELEVKGNVKMIPNGSIEGFIIINSGIEPQILPTSNNFGYLGDVTSRIYQGHFTNMTVYGTFTNTSDRRIKENILPLSGALDKVLQLSGKTYDYTKEYMFGDAEYPEAKTLELEKSRKNKIGFIAQELEEVLPELVKTDPETDLKSVDYIGVIPILVESIKEQQTMIDDLQRELNRSQNQQELLLKRLEALEAQVNSY